MLKIAILLDDFTSLNPKTDSSLAIAKRLDMRGHKVFYFHPRAITWQHGSVYAHGCECILNLEMQPYFNITSNYYLDLSECDIILVRHDPPFDMNYLTPLYLLEMIQKNVLIVNNPTSIREMVEKLSPLNFPQFLPNSIITGQLQTAKDFASQYEYIVAKALYGHAGLGVKKFAMRQSAAEQQLAEFLEENGYIILQEYLQEVEHAGDKRVLIVDGQIMSAFGRMPKKGDFRANMAVGGSAVKAELTPKELEICTSIAPELKKHHIFMAGVDILNERLLEINVTSPTGFVAASELYGEDFALKVVQKLEAML